MRSGEVHMHYTLSSCLKGTGEDYGWDDKEECREGDR